jgi:ferritin-like metal-binding protein YciE
MLHESLEEEKQADVRLTKLAKGEVNPDALAPLPTADCA